MTWITETAESNLRTYPWEKETDGHPVRLTVGLELDEECEAETQELVCLRYFGAGAARWPRRWTE